MTDRSRAEAEALDRGLIEHIANEGADLTKARHVGVHFLTTTDDGAAIASAALEAEGWTASVTRLGDAEWNVFGGEIWMVVNEQTISDLRAHMEALASDVGAIFEGWQTLAIP